MSADLKNCPFCGGPAVNVAGEYITCGTPIFTSCPGRLVRADTEDWNTRAIVPAQNYAAEVDDIIRTAQADCGCRIPFPYDEVAEHAIGLALAAVAGKVTRLLSQGDAA